MKSYDIAGYVYKADTYCPSCTVDLVCTDRNLEHPHRSGFNHDLAQLAITLDIDWQDESTYDSDDFPKVIFTDQVEYDRCGKCGGML